MSTNFLWGRNPAGSAEMKPHPGRNQRTLGRNWSNWAEFGPVLTNFGDDPTDAGRFWAGVDKVRAETDRFGADTGHLRPNLALTRHISTHFNRCWADIGQLGQVLGRSLGQRIPAELDHTRPESDPPCPGIDKIRVPRWP